MVAKKLLNRREGDIAEGKAPSIDFEKMTFDELAADFIRDYEINEKKSLGRARQSMAHLNDEFEGVRVPDITTKRIQDQYIPDRKRWTCKDCNTKFHVGGEFQCPKCGSDRVDKGAANATINRELAALRRILNLGARQTPPKVNRVPYIPMLKENNVRKGFFEHEQFIALREQLPPYLKEFVSFGYKVGWRYHEVASLTWDHVDMQNGIVCLKAGETKNNDARTVYLDEELKEMFKSQWDKRKQDGKLCPFVFPNQEGTEQMGDFRKAWNHACREVGIGYGYKVDQGYVRKWEATLPSGPIFHDLRRTSVRNMVRSGVPERVVMTVSGHKTRAVFDRYNIVNDSDLKRASVLQEEYLKKQGDENSLGTISGTVAVINKKRG
ncbi:MAG: tyrosine-type recombinase/integrase [Desulfamplus sp.]|nr:tyrosine-type recombinase/integrase [Desulfamplus sp.]